MPATCLEKGSLTGQIRLLGILDEQARILIFEDQRPDPSVWEINYFHCIIILKRLRFMHGGYRAAKHIKRPCW
jgi:hypothetical protein